MYSCEQMTRGHPIHQHAGVVADNIDNNDLNRNVVVCSDETEFVSSKLTN